MLKAAFSRGRDKTFEVRNHATEGSVRECPIARARLRLMKRILRPGPMIIYQHRLTSIEQFGAPLEVDLVQVAGQFTYGFMPHPGMTERRDILAEC